VGRIHRRESVQRTTRLRLYAGLSSAAVLMWLLGAVPAGAATCASLAGLALPDTTITAVQSVAAGTYTAPDGEVFANLPAFCRIAATLTPTTRT
jgi:feruloyl esterase